MQACRYDVFSLVITELYSHLPMDLVFNNLQNLMSLQLTYGAKHMGMEYERPHIGMKMSDAQFLQDCLKTTNNLIRLSLPGNLIDDDLVSILSKGLMLNKTITQLDLSHNKIGNQGARKIAKYLLKTQILTHLDLSDNQIEYHGSRFLAQGIKENTSLLDFNLKLNRIDNKGGQKLCIDLMGHKGLVLQRLNLSSNALGKGFAESLAELIKKNQTLKSIDISCNFIDDGSASTLSTLKDSLRSNPRIVEFDMRNNEVQDETEEEIKQIITKNKLESQGIPFSKLAECKFFRNYPDEAKIKQNMQAA